MNTKYLKIRHFKVQVPPEFCSRGFQGVLPVTLPVTVTCITQLVDEQLSSIISLNELKFISISLYQTIHVILTNVFM